MQVAYILLWQKYQAKVKKGEKAVIFSVSFF